MNPDELSGQALSDAVAEAMGWKKVLVERLMRVGKVLYVNYYAWVDENNNPKYLCKKPKEPWNRIKLPVWQPHLDMNQCWEVLDEIVKQGWGYTIRNIHQGIIVALNKGSHHHHVIADNIQTAILRACLKAVGG